MNNTEHFEEISSLAGEGFIDGGNPIQRPSFTVKPKEILVDIEHFGLEQAIEDAKQRISELFNQIYADNQAQISSSKDNGK